MNNHHDILRKMESLRESMGWSEATLGNKLGNNARLVPRLRRAAARFDEIAERVEGLMAEVPEARPSAEAEQ